MANLKRSEMRFIDEVFGMGSGYVLDFSNRTFAEFFEDEFAINIYHGKYESRGGSKANHLRTLIEGAAAAVSALTAKAKLAGMWREKVDQHNTGNPVYERIERVIVERPTQSARGSIPDENTYDEPSTEVVPEMPHRHWSAD